MSHREVQVKVVTWVTVTSSREMAVRKGRWWEIRGIDGGVCCPGSSRKGVGVPIHGNDCLLWQLVWTQGEGPSVKVIRKIDFWTLVPFYIIKPGNILLLMISAVSLSLGSFGGSKLPWPASF